MKLSIVGIGRVGAALAHEVILRGLADELVLVNRTHETAVGEALDLTHALSFVDRRCTIRAGAIADTAGSEVIVVAASVPMSSREAGRNAMAAGNAALFRELIPKLAAASPDALLLIVSNPVDAMTWLAGELRGFDPSRVIGTGTLIDSARFRTMLSMEVGIHPDDLRAYILGEHGETQFPALSAALAGGVRIEDSEMVRDVFDRTMRAGHEVVRRKGHTSYAVAGAAALIIEAVVHDSRRTIPVSTRIDGFAGVAGVSLSLPCVIGRGGVQRVLHPAFNERELEAWRRSGEAVRAVIDGL